MTLNPADEALERSLDSLRETKNIHASNAKIVGILQSFPCLMRCGNDLENVNYNNTKLDPLYIAKHEYAKKKIIDAISFNFSSYANIRSEHQVKNGKFDIAILYNKIILKYQDKIICVEVKSGKTIDIFQLERYLYDCDVLLIVRVPTQDVIAIHQMNLEDELNAGLASIIQKIAQVNADDPPKIPGTWCRGCTASCEFKKEGNDNENKASLSDLEDFFKNVNAVVHKTIAVLKNELVPIS